MRLGLWQLGRWNEKRRLNAQRQSLLAAAPLSLGAMRVPAADLVGRKLVITGRYDEARQFLLLARFHAGEPGVEIVTPLTPRPPTLVRIPSLAIGRSPA